MRPTQDDIDLESSSTKGLSCEFSEAFKHIFEFVDLRTFGGPTSCPIDGSHADEVNICRQASVYARGERYGIAGLKETALQKFEHSAEVSWQTDTLCKDVKIVFTSKVGRDQGLRKRASSFAIPSPKVALSNHGVAPELLVMLCKTFSYRVMSDCSYTST